MTLAQSVRILSLALAATMLVVVPLANPLLVSLGLILGGVLAAWRGAADLASPAASPGVVFRHAL
ncbi:hypothetical protein [Methylobacterium dankookense]|uniref:Uncharacterized protein n=1 Tax=Methylobacterium dankookense TaxID=560405 RepID=A0A564G580_9HYPH|nr:hypothetical protein [Methylobacterium dankookense]GJD54634.1 hypothetical protein IFDJLNFL_0509 [Methylobacterium dankookense]VUF15695.1 hypothetical protein MTDSW087_05439 [Methylobacterium dankookense]